MDNDKISGELDLTNCDKEPIHLLGRVQAFGFLIAVSSDWIVTHVSKNVGEFIGYEAQDMIGKPASAFIPPTCIHAVRNRLQFLSPGRGLEVIYGAELSGTDTRFDVSAHVILGSIIMEFEPASSQDGAATDIANVRSAIDKMVSLEDVERIYSQAVRFIKMILRFDRVMLYKFAADGTGEVVAETLRRGMEPFLKLRYPASDIPRQARALYIENPIRLIADVNDIGAVIVQSPVQESTLDLSGSRLRAVSPIHLEYLRNMGVGASMSISIIVEGELWGLIACHNEKPLTPNMRERNTALLFGQMLSHILQIRLSEKERSKDTLVAQLTADVAKTMASGLSAPELLKSSTISFMELLGADGYAVVQDGIVSSGGSVPEQSDILAICESLNSLPNREVFTTHSLGSILTPFYRFAHLASGLLAIPISRSPRDYIMFFRKELVQEVRWAGNPDKPVSYGPNGARLTPRKSFEAWQTTVRGESEHWTQADRRAATQLRIMLLEIVLRLTDEAGRERKLANERQEVLIAELNHRVKNILGLVRGLISQSNSGVDTTADFVRKLDSRVHALARAHDQITQVNWGPVSFRQLISLEAESYLLDKKNRVRVNGANALLTPQAYSSIALVMHEMITNSAKYGAVSDRRGEVEIELAFDFENNLTIAWTESGGPAVKAPKRRGFGSTIIERTIPFELKGKAEIAYNPKGVQATFWIPAIHVIAGVSSGNADQAERRTIVTGLELPRSVLVVEDNLLIAMDAEDIFRSLGAEEVRVVGSVQAALLELASNDGLPVEFALLDVNLGNETSHEVARQLKRSDIQFVFATGYGENAKMPEDLSGARFIGKPYDKDAISALFASATGSLNPD